MGKEFHTYEIDWTPKNISWFVDGVVLATANGTMPSNPGSQILILRPESNEFMGGANFDVEFVSYTPHDVKHTSRRSELDVLLLAVISAFVCLVAIGLVPL